MKIDSFADAESASRQGAATIAAEARAAVAARGRFFVAFSGGRNPWRMLRVLADEDVPWPRVQVFQVDERVAPDGHPDRNLTHLRESLLAHAPLAAAQIHAMPVQADDLERAAAAYAGLLAAAAGAPPVLDLVHLGLGPDGHTASLVPGDPVLEIDDRDVAVTAVYQGRRRMTLTFPALNRARRVLWFVTDNAEMLARLARGDLSIPAGRVCQDRAVVIGVRSV